MRPETAAVIASLRLSEAQKAELCRRVETAIQDSIRRETEAAIRAERTHCKHGHALTPDNVYLSLNRHRRLRTVCKTCDRARHAPRAVRVSL